MSQYRLIFTNIGLSKKQNAELNNDYIQITQFAVGSGVITNLNPSLTALLIEEYRANINNVDTKDGVTVFDLVIPSDVGGFYIKEVALFDVDGDCICIGTVPITYKVNQDEGASKAIHLKVSTTSTNTENIVFNTDDSLVYATVSYVNNSVNALKNEMLLELPKKVNVLDVKNGLFFSDTDKPLSAAMGKLLKQYIDNINTLLLSDNSAIDNLQEIVDFIELHQATLDTLGIANIAGLQNALNAKLGVNSNAASATKLFTPRLIGGVDFDGTVNINLPGVNTKGNQDTSGTADNAKYQQLIGGQTTCDTYFKATPAGKTSFNEIANYADAPTTTDWYFLHNIRHSNGSNYWGAQIAYSLNNSTGNKIFQRTIDQGTWSAWTRVDVSGSNLSELIKNIDIDAQTLDGLDSSSFLRKDITQEIKNGVWLYGAGAKEIIWQDGATLGLGYGYGDNILIGGTLKRDLKNIGFQQSWQDMKSQRASHVTYTNNTARSICVSVGAVGRDAIVKIWINGVMVAFDQDTYDSPTNHSTAQAIVPAGATYYVEAFNKYGTAGALEFWAELR